MSNGPQIPTPDPMSRAASAAGQVPIDSSNGNSTDETETPPIEMPPVCWGDYELLEILGRGGSGVVYQARQKRLGRFVALKLLAPGIMNQNETFERFRRETESLAGLNHPNIVPIFEVGVLEGRPWFSMRLLTGGNLAGQIDAYRDAPQKAARIMIDVADAVFHAHEHGILHRDLKPSNILLDERGAPQVTDFGLARRLDETSELTPSGAVLGSPPYMAPEQALGLPGAATPAADVYSLGAVLYALLTGRTPFCGQNLAELIRQAMFESPASPRKLNPRVDRNLDSICQKCLEKLPERRYASAAAFADDLQRSLAGQPISARPRGRFRRIRDWLRRHPAAATVGGVLLVFSIVPFIPLSGIFPHIKTAPVGVTSVSTTGVGITNGAGRLNAGKSVILIVNFDAAVTVNTVNGLPTLSLNDGGTALYSGESGTSAVTFQYPVTPGQNTSDLTVTAFNLNRATVQIEGVNADLTRAVTNPAGTLQIDTLAPTASISLVGVSNQLVGRDLSYSVTFSELVTGVDASADSFTLTVSGVTGSAISGVTRGSDAAHYTVNVSSGSGEGTIALNMTGSAIRDLAGNGFGGGKFSGANNFPAGSNPVGIAIGEFNQDDNPDMVVANFYDNSISVFQETGRGTFGPARTYGVGACSWYPAVGDFNGDGKADIAVANRNDNSVSVLLGHGTGHFEAASTFALDASPNSISVADVNGDGNADIITSNYFGDTVSILLGTGTGRFGSATSLSVGPTPRYAATSDVTGDGITDIVTSNETPGTVSVLRGTGAGRFAEPVTFAAGTHPVFVAIADLNRDGRADLVTASFDGNAVNVLLGTGGGNFSFPSSFAVGDTPKALAIGDINGDAIPDIVVPNSGSNSVSVLLGSGTGRFGSAAHYPTEKTPYYVAIVDLNKDGKSDLAVTNWDGKTVSVLLNGRFAQLGPVYTMILPAK